MDVKVNIYYYQTIVQVEAHSTEYKIYSWVLY